MPTVKRSIWYAHSEAILQTMLCSEDQKERIWGVEKILAIRGDGDPDPQLGDSSVRTRRTPDINCDASCIGDLISWSEDVSEPPLTCSLSTSGVKLVNTPMEVLNWPCHTQSIERVLNGTYSTLGSPRGNHSPRSPTPLDPAASPVPLLQSCGEKRHDPPDKPCPPLKGPVRVRQA
ncbi:hypothetical protein GWK47_029867 [Chionoecetes opilio]|uniref:Uncharacterized protein n=1 Tax=Chionoecetes opilio TaxID=41210 RepID=A0A8J5D1U7_CHIOP|nr:hypothetical protein GWK47_029867 [Chionoecetes opilio]